MTNSEGKVPCQLVGEDGNAFAIMGRVVNALKDNGQGHKAEEFRQKAVSGDYNNLLRTAMEYVYEHNPDDEDCDVYDDDDDGTRDYPDMFVGDTIFYEGENLKITDLEDGHFFVKYQNVTRQGDECDYYYDNASGAWFLDD